MRPWLALGLVVAVGCGGGATAPYHASFAPVDSDGAMLRDGEGRALFLRGVNARVAGVFDVTFSDGRAPREAIPSFGADDVTAMKAAGFTLLRLPIDWSAIEPMQGVFDSGYLDRVAAVVDLLRGSGIYVLLDLHQDGYSKELCEDGAPLWAIDPPPDMLVGGPGPLAGPTDCHTAPGAIAAFNSLFADDGMLQEDYASMAATLAQRFAGDAQLLGYEVMNEPLGDENAIMAFNAKVAAAIRAVDAQHLVLFEPTSTRNIFNFAPYGTAPFAVAGSVYSVHIYTGVFTSTPLSTYDYASQMQASVVRAREEAQSWSTPLLVTEFGIGADNSEAGAWLGHFLDDADQSLSGWTLWLWKEESQGAWGLYEPDDGGSFTARPAMFAAVSRPYAQAVGGDPTAMSWDGTTLTVAFSARGDVPGRHDIFWPGSAAPRFSCDGHAVTPSATDPTAGKYTVACGHGHGKHTLTAE